MMRLIIKPLLWFMTIGVIGILCGYLIYCSVILMWSQNKTIALHDAIIVLTGSKGRIETGFDLLLGKKAPKLLISGVKESVSFDDLIATNSDNLSKKEVRDIRTHCCITLDYVADTTESNASESQKWLKTKGIKSFILVTSASHMPRAYLLFNATVDTDIKITTYPYQPQRRFNLVMSFDFWQDAAREYIKFGGNLVRLGRQ